MDETERYVPAYRFRWLSLFISVLSATNGWLDDVTEMLCAHHNWNLDREKTVREAHADIERIVAGE